MPNASKKIYVCQIYGMPIHKLAGIYGLHSLFALFKIQY